MVRLFAAVLGLSLCLLMVSSISPVAFGGDVVEVVNGDTNGDGEGDISDATYYLRWLFRGGPDPVAIICPEDLGAMVTELEGALAVANDALAAASSENEILAGQAAGLEAELVAANDSLVVATTSNSAKDEEIAALQAELAAANASLGECEASLPEPDPEPEPEPGN